MLRFWGTRGSLPAPRASTVHYGGNTSCVELRVAGRLLILDAGSGIRGLGAALMRQKGSIQADLFLTHYHWDHIHGFPFFMPAFVPGNHFTIYGEARAGQRVHEILAGQMTMPYFPVPLKAMRAQIEFRDVEPGARLKFGPVTVRTETLNHPGRAISYRVECGGRAIVYATDHEHGTEADQRLVQHAAGADVLIYDASFTPEEYRLGRKGWGHSTWTEGIRIAREAGAKRLVLFHHEPSRDDRALAAIERAARRVFRFTSAAREGQRIRL